MQAADTPPPALSPQLLRTMAAYAEQFLGTAYDVLMDNVRKVILPPEQLSSPLTGSLPSPHLWISLHSGLGRAWSCLALLPAASYTCRHGAMEQKRRPRVPESISRAKSLSKRRMEGMLGIPSEEPADVWRVLCGCRNFKNDAALDECTAKHRWTGLWHDRTWRAAWASRAHHGTTFCAS